jgi:hypothetical protein
VWASLNGLEGADQRAAVMPEEMVGKERVGRCLGLAHHALRGSTEDEWGCGHPSKEIGHRLPEEGDRMLGRGELTGDDLDVKGIADLPQFVIGTNRGQSELVLE